ncbi:hypothetical protein ACHZ98_15905 [Streptomyces sp. MAR4 CNY-716]
MKLAAQVKLLPASAHDADAPAATLRACNRAATWVSEVAHAKGRKRRNELQEEVYYDTRAAFGLAAQPAVRVIKKVVDAYATLRVLHADHNGSRNIAHRADAAWQRGAVNRPRTSRR